MALFEKPVSDILVNERYIKYIDVAHSVSAAPARDGMKVVSLEHPLKKAEAEQIAARAKEKYENHVREIEKQKKKINKISVSYTNGAEEIYKRCVSAGVQFDQIEQKENYIMFHLSEYDYMNFDKIKREFEREAMSPIRKATPAEHRSTEKAADQLLQLIPEAPEQQPIPPAKEWRTKEKQRKRKNQIMTRLTDEELATFNSRVELTGQRQADYIRAAVLTGSINQLPANNAELMAIHQDLLDIRAELGKIGGLLKSTIKPNEQNPLASEEIAEVKKKIKELTAQQKRIDKEVNKIWQ